MSPLDSSSQAHTTHSAANKGFSADKESSRERRPGDGGEFDTKIQAALASKLVKLGAQTGSEISNAMQAISDSLQNPTDFPSLRSAILPGDTVAICLRGSTPRIAEIVDGVLDAVISCQPAAVDILLDETADGDCLECVDQVAGSRATVHLHDASIRADLSYLAADTEARPIYLNRFLVDADFVLPIVVDHDAFANEASVGIESLVYPAFTDSATRIRLTQSRDFTVPSPSPAWLLGIQLVTQIALNREGEICRIESRMRRESQPVEESHRVDSSNHESHPAVIVSLASNSGCRWMQAIDSLQRGSQALEENGILILAALPTGPLPEDTLGTGVASESVDASQESESDDANQEPGRGDANRPDSETLPAWDPMQQRVQTLVDLTQSYRVFFIDGFARGGDSSPANGESDLETNSGPESQFRERLSSEWGIEILPDVDAMNRLLANQSCIGWLKTC